jgi:hypothetical protein
MAMPSRFTTRTLHADSRATSNRWRIVKSVSLFAAGVASGAIIHSSSLGAEPAAIKQPSASFDESEQPRSMPDVAKPRRQIKRSFLVRSPEQCAENNPEKERAYREQQSTDLINLLLGRLDIMDSSEPDGDPEVHATRLLMYQKGLMDAIVRTAPDLADELAAGIERELCSGSATVSRVISLSHFIHDMPELANERAFDCIASRGKEDAMLWAVLDAWRATGMPPTPAIAKIQQTATDERTRSRFETDQDLLERSGNSDAEQL